MIARDPTHVNVLDVFSGWLSRPKTAKTAKSANFSETAQLADLVIPPTITDDELRQLRSLLLHYGTLSNKQVARLMGVAKGEASKRVSKAVAAGMVSRVKVGKSVAITLH